MKKKKVRIIPHKEELFNVRNINSVFSTYKYLDSMLSDVDSNFHKLTMRQKIGYLFEMEGQEAFRENNVDFIANPIDPLLWQKDIRKGYDCGIKINRRVIIASEFKKINYKIYPVHYYESWKPRFEDIAVQGIHKVFTVSDKDNVSDSVKKLIERDGYELKTLQETIDFYKEITPNYTIKTISHFIKKLTNPIITFIIFITSIISTTIPLTTNSILNLNNSKINGSVGYG